MFSLKFHSNYDISLRMIYINCKDLMNLLAVAAAAAAAAAASVEMNPQNVSKQYM